MKSTKHWSRRTQLLLFALALAAGLSGCSTTQYYWQAIRGEVDLLSRQESIERVVQRTDISPALREKLKETLDLRQFAEKELHLPVNGQYQNYVDVRRRFVVWNVHAAPPYSLKARTWWYPWVGRLKYRGFFHEEEARALAAQITAQGDDVYLGGVEAYSTLGWFRDPILSTFIHHDSADLAEILFHELAHQKVFISGDTDFNEAFAVSVAQEGTRRWLRSRKTHDEVQRYDEDLRKERTFADLVQKTRAQLDALYRSLPATETNQLQTRKVALLDDMRRSHDILRANWGNQSPYDAWFTKPINNAQLNTFATYLDLVPNFDRLLASHGGDLQKFYSSVAKLGTQSPSERRAVLSGQKK